VAGQPRRLLLPQNRTTPAPAWDGKFVHNNGPEQLQQLGETPTTGYAG